MSVLQKKRKREDDSEPRIVTYTCTGKTSIVRVLKGNQVALPCSSTFHLYIYLLLCLEASLQELESTIREGLELSPGTKIQLHFTQDGDKHALKRGSFAPVW